MTRGRVYLMTKKDGWLESAQLLYDMGFNLPNENGTKFISVFLRRRIENKKSLDSLLMSLFLQWDKDGDILGSEEELSWRIGNVLSVSGIGDDYSYILNCGSKNETILVDGEEVVVEKNEMLVLSFSKIVLRIRRRTGKIKLALNENEVLICVEALDFYNRIFLGQYNHIYSRWIWRINDPTIIYDRRSVCEHILLAIRGIIMKNSDLDQYGFGTSLGIWNDRTDIRAKNSYDIQQVMRYHLAYTKNPEGGHSVDFSTPMIKGNLPEIGCKCFKEENDFKEEITCNPKHLQILDDALLIFNFLYNVQIGRLFRYYTDDAMALKLAKDIDVLFSGIKPDEKYIKEILDIRKKIIYAGG